MARWFIFLQQYDLTIFHIGGEFNLLADCLSRSVDLTTEEEQEVDEMIAPAFVISEEMPHFPFDVRLPRTLELISEYEHSPPDELRQTTADVDGLRYGVKSRKL